MATSSGPLIMFKKPTRERIQAFVDAQASAPLGYAPVGLTDLADPVGWTVDDNRRVLGVGDEVYERAKRGIDEWKMFSLGWVEAVAEPFPPPIEVGTTVAVVARSLGLTFVNACRIVRVIDEPDRYGFVYGTTVGHVERGEERFLVERDEEGEVTFSILACSQPAHWLTRLGYFYARTRQHRFAQEALAALSP